MIIQQTPYDSNFTTQLCRPLFIASSGGNGHIAGSFGIYNFLKKKYGANIEFTQHKPRQYDENQLSFIGKQIKPGAFIMNDLPIISHIVKHFVRYFNIPILPNSHALEEEINRIKVKANSTAPLHYIDMLYDLHQDGPLYVALWNALQRQDDTKALQSIIHCQNKTDQDNYHSIVQKIVDLLNEAKDNGTPYTEVISTQAMALPALCDAVRAFNTANPDLDPIFIHQYMTDIARKGAVHFFHPLSSLNAQQQSVMKLYGVGMKESIIQHFFPSGCHFKSINCILPQDNPLIREAFTNPAYDNSNQYESDVTIELTQKGSKQIHTILAKAKIASIMLGSQASNDTTKYLETLLNNGTDKVFVFGGEIPTIQNRINDIISQHPEYQSKIIALGDQNDQQITQLITRSNIVDIRGGGLSVMEEMAMPHNPQQLILLHHPDSNTSRLTTGISWEDDNITDLIEYLQPKNIIAKRTSPNSAKRQIPAFQLLLIIQQAAILEPEIKKNLAQYLEIVSDETIKQYSRLNPDDFIKQITTDYNEHLEQKRQAKQKQEDWIKGINQDLLERCNECKEYLCNALKNNPSSPETMRRSYEAILRLIAILTDETIASETERLLQFKSEYEKPETQNALLDNQDNFIIRFFREIAFLMAKAFNYLGFGGFFTPLFSEKQKIRYAVETTTNFSCPAL